MKIKYQHNIKFLTIITLLLFSCKKKWDPNEQFEKQTKAIQNEEKIYQTKITHQAKLNLIELEGRVTNALTRGLYKQKLNDLLGNNYNLLAHDQNSNQRWERRLYLWERIVEAKWGANSLEFKFCEKNREFVIVTINEIKVVTVEFL